MMLLAGCTAIGPATSRPVGLELFPPGSVADYQLGEAYEPADEVTVVVRDASEQPLSGAYSICYINGFQSQPGEQWPAKLLLRTAEGDAVIDPNWPDETILDIRSADNRAAIVERLTPLTAQCAERGFDAVEFDNLDSYSRSDGKFGLDATIEMATLLVSAGHDAGLAVGQKNTGELLGDAVIDVEYTADLRRSFSEVCADALTPVTTMLRDRNLTAPGSPDYVFEHC
jgi:hypothetical protein